jgi:predicted tellurium resistance membrane protein TerC
MKKIIYWLGVVIAVLATIGMVSHRFYNPDMTQIRWFIEFWYIWLAWFVSVLIGAFMTIIHIK